MGQFFGTIGRSLAGLFSLEGSWIDKIWKKFIGLFKKKEEPPLTTIIPPTTKIMTIAYNGNGQTSASNTVPTSEKFETQGWITLKPAGNMTKTGHVFGGWRCPSGQIRQPGRYWYDTADSGTWMQTAVWIPKATIRYQLLVNSNITLNTARGWMNTIKPAFLSTFGVDLVEHSGSSTTELDEKPGCQWTTPPNNFCVYMPSNPSLSCGPFDRCSQDHHKSLHKFLLVNQRNDAIKVFRFVDFKLCSYYPDDGSHASKIGGFAFLDSDMIVTSILGSPLRNAAHEISHLLGARDTDETPCTPNQTCMMNYDHDTYQLWCNAHKAEIEANL